MWMTQRVVWTGYQAYCSGYCAGRAWFGNWVQVLLRSPYFQLNDLDAGALATIAQSLPPASAIRKEAERRLQASDPSNPGDLGEAIIDFQRRTSELWIQDAVWDRVNPAAAIYSAASLYAEVVPGLKDYISRLFQVDEAPAAAWAEHAFWQAYWKVPIEERWPFRGLCLLFATQMSRPFPGPRRTSQPAWFKELQADERAFLTRAWTLGGGAQSLLFATVYAGANCRELVPLVGGMQGAMQNVSPFTAERALERAWRTFLGPAANGAL